MTGEGGLPGVVTLEETESDVSSCAGVSNSISSGFVVSAGSGLCCRSSDVSVSLTGSVLCSLCSSKIMSWLDFEVDRGSLRLSSVASLIVKRRA